MHATEALATSRRAMEVCNACRYCEGFCAVFPAMELRRGFTDGDLSYLANLCHNCQGCYHACQYAPPHPFGINVPQSFSLLRMESYAQHAWPAPLARLFQRNALATTLAMVVAILLVLGTAMLAEPGALYAVHHGRRSFYAVIPWGVMAGLAGATLLFALVALGMGARNFWRESGAAGITAARPILAALHDVLTLKNLGGGGHGCNDRSERFSMLRRRLHHAMFYGFLLCFLSTCSGFVFADLLGHPAPYPFLSVPVLLGTAGRRADGGRHRRLALGQGGERPGTGGARAGRRRSRAAGVAAARRRHRPAAAGLPRQRRDGRAARAAPRDHPRAVPAAAVHEVRARHLSNRCPAARGDGAAARVIRGFAILLLCQLIGEIAARTLALPVPGPVLGLLLLAAGLLLRGRTRKAEGADDVGAVGPVADGLLANLALLFVPAGVGVVQYLPLLARQGPALATALVVSTLASLVVTVLVFVGVKQLQGRAP